MYFSVQPRDQRLKSHVVLQRKKNNCFFFKAHFEYLLHLSGAVGEQTCEQTWTYNDKLYSIQLSLKYLP